MFSTAYGTTARTGRIATVAGMLLVGSLTLTACGSDDDEAGSSTPASTGAGSAVSTASATGGATDVTGSPASSTDGPDHRSDPEHSGEAADPAAPGGGIPAAGDDAAQIIALTTGLNGAVTVADSMQYTLDHSCSSYIERQGGHDAVQQQVDMMRQNDVDLAEAGGANEVTEVTDIRVSGDTATATAVGTIQGQPRSETVTYQRENGAWVLCPAA